MADYSNYSNRCMMYFSNKDIETLSNASSRWILEQAEEGKELISLQPYAANDLHVAVVIVGKKKETTLQGVLNETST